MRHGGNQRKAAMRELLAEYQSIRPANPGQRRAAAQRVGVRVIRM